MVETPGKNLSIDGTPIIGSVKAGRIERVDLAIHKRGVKTRRNAAENHDA
jgi:hypothetical protein